MSAVESLNIVLQHDIDEHYQYQPGEVVRGTINVKISRPTAIQAITLKIYGEGNVSWKDDDSDEMFHAEEVYVDVAKAVIDTTNLHPLNLHKGNHEFAFDYLMPDNIPSSYIGKHGNVTYTMRVTVTGVNPVDTSISSEPFLVIRGSMLPDKAERPLTLNTEKRIWGACCFGKLYASVTVEKQGGVPGEDIFLKAEIKNRSHRTATAMQASLIMSSTFRAQHHTTCFRQVVSKRRDEFDVSHMEGRRWTYVRLTLPPYIPESKLDHCDIIELDYIFQFRVELSGGSEIKMEAPFWIGANPQGLEIPVDERTGSKINRHWTVRGSKKIEDIVENGEVKPIMEYNDGWGVETVPELRPESAVVSNPLFQPNNFLQNGVKVLPDEFIENTKL